jgi:ABC-type multidrug transport system ATPase subunit
VSRQQVWAVIRELTSSGVTLLLATQYLDEADALADRIVVVSHGRVNADGTPRELKERSRNAHVEVTLSQPRPRLSRHGTSAGAQSDSDHPRGQPLRGGRFLALTRERVSAGERCRVLHQQRGRR